MFRVSKGTGYCHFIFFYYLNYLESKSFNIQCGSFLVLKHYMTHVSHNNVAACCIATHGCIATCEEITWVCCHMFHDKILSCCRTTMYFHAYWRRDMFSRSLYSKSHEIYSFGNPKVSWLWENNLSSFTLIEHWLYCNYDHQIKIDKLWNW